MMYDLLFVCNAIIEVTIIWYIIIWKMLKHKKGCFRGMVDVIFADE